MVLDRVANRKPVSRPFTPLAGKTFSGRDGQIDCQGIDVIKQRLQVDQPDVTFVASRVGHAHGTNQRLGTLAEITQLEPRQASPGTKLIVLRVANPDWPLRHGAELPAARHAELGRSVVGFGSLSDDRLWHRHHYGVLARYRSILPIGQMDAVLSF